MTVLILDPALRINNPNSSTIRLQGDGASLRQLAFALGLSSAEELPAVQQST
jgi:hypothetical protein